MLQYFFVGEILNILKRPLCETTTFIKIIWNISRLVKNVNLKYQLKTYSSKIWKLIFVLRSFIHFRKCFISKILTEHLKCLNGKFEKYLLSYETFIKDLKNICLFERYQSTIWKIFGNLQNVDHDYGKYLLILKKIIVWNDQIFEKKVADFRIVDLKNISIDLHSLVIITVVYSNYPFIPLIPPKQTFLINRERLGDGSKSSNH